MEKLLQKRVVFFSKIYFTMLSIGLLLFIYSLDAEESRQDMRYILGCSQYNDIDISALQENNEIEDKLYSSLYQTHPKLWKENKETRERLADLLQNEYGAMNMYSLKSREERKFNLIGIDTAYKRKLSGFTNQKKEYATVKECLSKMELLAKPFTVQVLRSFDENTLRQVIDSLFLSPEKDPFTAYPDDAPEYEVEPEPNISETRSRTFDRVTLIKEINYENGGFCIKTESGGRNPQTGGIATPDIPLSGKEEKIAIRSINEVLQFENNDVKELLGDRELMNRIYMTYGDLYIDDCIKLLSEENSKNFKSVEVFGFQLSRQRLVFAFLFFSLLSSIAIYASTRKAAKLHLKIITNTNEDDPLFLLIENVFIRFFVWCLAPIIITYASFNYETTTIVTNSWVVLILAVILFLNSRSYIHSLKL